MVVKMGIGLLGFDKVCLKRKFRWFMHIDGVSELEGDRINVFMPQKGARPSMEFKEIECQHLNEIVYYPAKPSWKPIPLTLYEHKTQAHPVFNWMRRQYNPENSNWCLNDSKIPGVSFKIPVVFLRLYDGCGYLMENWTLENVWPQAIDFGELDMGNSEVVTCDLTLRYDRANIIYPSDRGEYAC